MGESKWFGREPALVIQSIVAVFAVVAGFGVTAVNDSVLAAVTAFGTAAAAAWTAWSVRPWAPAVFSGVVTTGATLAASFGFHLAQQQVGAIAAGAVTVMALLTRAQVTPEHDPSTDVVTVRSG